MKQTMAVLSFLGMVIAPALEAQDVNYRTERTDDGAVVAVHEAVIPASVSDTWEAFTTREGLTSWAVPFSAVDFRLGGIWESSYDRAAQEGDPGNIRNRYLSFVPERMLAIQAVQAPPNFPHPELLPELFTVFELEPVADDSTRVTVYGVGYRDTPSSNAVRELFREGNAWSLRMLHRRFAEGPVDWADALSGGGP